MLRVPCEYVAAMKDRHPCETTGPNADVRDVRESVRAQMCATWQLRAASHGDSILAQMCSWPPGRRRPRATTTDAEARAQLCLALVGSVKRAKCCLVRTGVSWAVYAPQGGESFSRGQPRPMHYCG